MEDLDAVRAYKPTFSNIRLLLTIARTALRPENDDTSSDLTECPTVEVSD